MQELLRPYLSQESTLTSFQGDLQPLAPSAAPLRPCPSSALCLLFSTIPSVPSSRLRMGRGSWAVKGEQRGHSSLAGRTGPYTGRSAPCNSVLLVLHAPHFGHCQGISHQHTMAGVTCTESSSPGLSCVVLSALEPCPVGDWPVRLPYKELSRAAVSTPRAAPLL